MCALLYALLLKLFFKTMQNRTYFQNYGINEWTERETAWCKFLINFWVNFFLLVFLIFFWKRGFWHRIFCLDIFTCGWRECVANSLFIYFFPSSFPRLFLYLVPAEIDCFYEYNPLVWMYKSSSNHQPSDAITINDVTIWCIGGGTLRQCTNIFKNIQQTVCTSFELYLG